MAQPNANYTDIMATTIESRSRKIQDNVTNNNYFLRKMNSRGNVRTFSGGTKILEEISFAENSNTGWYSGYDILPVGVSEVISTAEYEIRQAAVPVVMSGLEMLKNASREQMIDLMRARIKVAESSMANLIAEGLYSDGTAAAGKQIEGLGAALTLDPSTSGAYGGIDASDVGSEFWANAVSQPVGGVTSATIQQAWNGLWAQLVRGADSPDLIMVDNTVWELYVASLQNQQRFTNTNDADAGFTTIKYMTADVCLDGGIYDFGRTGAASGRAYFLNTDYMHYRPHSARNMVPLAPNRRYATNQDAEVQILAFAGNLTCSGRKFQGLFDNNG